MLVAPGRRSVAKWLALAGLVAALAVIYLLTEQSSRDTMVLTESTVHGVAAIAGGAAGGGTVQSRRGGMKMEQTKNPLGYERLPKLLRGF